MKRMLMYNFFNISMNFLNFPFVLTLASIYENEMGSLFGGGETYDFLNFNHLEPHL